MAIRVHKGHLGLALHDYLPSCDIGPTLLYIFENNEVKNMTYLEIIIFEGVVLLQVV